jgi:hypothetical protein
MTTLTLRYIKGHFVVTGPDIEPNRFKTRRERTGARRTTRAREITDLRRDFMSASPAWWRPRGPRVWPGPSGFPRSVRGISWRALVAIRRNTAGPSRWTCPYWRRAGCSRSCVLNSVRHLPANSHERTHRPIGWRDR